jgi:hypothetical protein
MRLQSFTLAPVAGLLLDCEALIGQNAPHGPGDGEGGDPRAGSGAGRDQGHDLGRPHAGIQGGGKAVQEPGVCEARPLFERPMHITDGKVDAGVPLRQVEAVEAGRPFGPDGENGRSGFGQFGPGREGAGGLVAAEGKAFDGKDVQATVGCSGAAPQVQQGHDVQPGAETQFSHGEVGAAGPGARQAAAFQEDGAGLGQAVVLGEIDVAESAGTGRAVLGPEQLGGGGVVRAVGSFIGHGGALAASRVAG